MSIPIELESEQTGSQIVATLALLDSGAGGIFLDTKFVEENNIPTYTLQEPLMVYNVDGTRNTQGTITHATQLQLKIANRIIPTQFLITGLGQYQQFWDSLG